MGRLPTSASFNNFVHTRSTMLQIESFLMPVEILLQAIISDYLNTTYCLTFVSENPINSILPVSFTYVVPNEKCSLTNQILQVSEMGCSDYIVHMEDPQKFMTAIEEVNQLGNARRSDRKIIIVPFAADEDNSETLYHILSLKESSYVPNLLLIIHSKQKTDNCVFFDLVTHKYVGPDDHNQPLYLDRWNSCSRTFDNKSNLFPHDMRNLHGKTLKVACFTYKPYVLLDLDTAVAPLGRDGTEMRIMDEFCRWINCTVEIIRDDAHQWGEAYENRSGVGVIGNVIQDRADVGITALYSWYEEYVVFDFSAPSIRTAITCIAPAPRLLASWEMPLLPFSLYMWLALAFTFVYACIGLTIAQKCSTDRVLLTTFGMMITQSQHDAGSTWRIRSVTGWLLISGLVLDNAYGGGLASVFTVPKYEPSIDTVQDIVDRKMEWGATHDAWVYSLTLSSEPLVMQLVSQFRVTPAEELKKRSFIRNMAFSIEKLPAGYFAVGDYITKEALLDLSIMKEDFYYEQCVAMLRKSSPYTKKISQLLGRLHESGLMNAWETQVALKHLNFEVQLEVKLSHSRKDVDTIEPLNFRHVVGIFIIYATGGIISIFFFFIEIFVYRKHKIST